MAIIFEGLIKTAVDDPVDCVNGRYIALFEPWVRVEGGGFFH